MATRAVKDTEGSSCRFLFGTERAVKCEPPSFRGSNGDNSILDPGRSPWVFPRRTNTPQGEGATGAELSPSWRTRRSAAR